MSNITLPTDYTQLTWRERREVREQYIIEQDCLCHHCSHNLYDPPPIRITDREIDWSLFPPNFLKHPIHLQHNHDTGMTEGAVHAYCNAVLWQYLGR